jgi:saccharopine dehydrogenase (NAD+, L-lysine-forming)
MKIGILREEKVPADKRVPFTPDQCRSIEQCFSGTKIYVQKSDVRCFSDDEYQKQGIAVVEDISDCDIMVGVKEVPVEKLIEGKKYLFFSHTIKKQAHNKKLLQEIIKKKIQLIDYECLVDNEFNRIIGFGHYAGIVGTYNGLMGYGLKYNLYDLKPAHLCRDKRELMIELQKVRLPNIKIVVTGNGRVANGAVELLGALQIRRVTPFEFVKFSFREPTYVQLHSNNYNEALDGSGWNLQTFYKHPEKFRSTFSKFTKACDLLLHCSYWNPAAPKLFTKEEMRSHDFHISVISDITCDIDGSIPSTTQSTTIENKFFGYNPVTEQIAEPFDNSTITVMAVDNLPCELPRDSSEDFGKELIDKVLPSLLNSDNDGIIERATIAINGVLGTRFQYLKDYAF